jgi:peroxin-16
MPSPSPRRPTLEAVARKTQRIPLVGLVGGLLSDYVPLIDSFYYYTAS